MTRQGVVTCAARLHDASPLAVHLAIRPRLPRLGLPPEPQAVRRKRWRLPPLALPTAGYWALMAGLTYAFAHLGAHPLESALASPAEPEGMPAPPAVQPAPVSEPAPAPLADAAPALVPAPAAEPEPEPEPATAQLSEPESRPSPERPLAPKLPFAPAPSPAPSPALALPPAPAPSYSFPEFTDSSARPRRERAADGPRIDSLFERADDDSRPSSPAETAPSEREPAPAAGPITSCEAAVARNNEQITLGGPRAPADITREAYASILQNGRYLAGCRIPERSVFEICAAVKDGRAVGITVVSTPASAELNACVRRAVAGLQFPSNPKLDVTHTRFDAVGR